MGSKVDVMGDNKSTPLHLPLASNQTAIAELLLDYKADPLLSDFFGFNALHVTACCVLDWKFGGTKRDMSGRQLRGSRSHTPLGEGK